MIHPLTCALPPCWAACACAYAYAHKPLGVFGRTNVCALCLVEVPRCLRGAFLHFRIPQTSPHCDRRGNLRLLRRAARRVRVCGAAPRRSNRRTTRGKKQLTTHCLIVSLGRAAGGMLHSLFHLKDGKDKKEEEKEAPKSPPGSVDLATVSMHKLAKQGAAVAHIAVLVADSLRCRRSEDHTARHQADQEDGTAPAAHRRGHLRSRPRVPGRCTGASLC